MSLTIDEIHEKWKSTGDLGTEFLTSLVTKAMTADIIEKHKGSEIFRNWSKVKSDAKFETVVLPSVVAGMSFGALTGYMAKGTKGLLIGAALGGAVTVGIAAAIYKLK